MSVIIGMNRTSAPRRSESSISRPRCWQRAGSADKAGYAGMPAAGRKFADRAWAVEGGNGIGRHIAHRLVYDGETVPEVPKLSAGSGCSQPATGARPTWSTRTQWPWPRCAARAWSGSRSTMTWS